MRSRPVFFFWLFSWVALGIGALAPAPAHAQAAAESVTAAPAPAPEGRRMGWFGVGVRLGFTHLNLTPPGSLVGAFNTVTGASATTGDYAVQSTARSITPTLHLGGDGFFVKMDVPFTFAPGYETYGIGLYPLNFGVYVPRVALFPYGSAGVASSIVQSRGTYDPATSNKIIGAVAQVRLAAGLKYFPMHSVALSFEMGYSPWAAGVMFLPPEGTRTATRTEGGFGSSWDLSFGLEWL